jgi:transcriptional antiterminator RfaH
MEQWYTLHTRLNAEYSVATVLQKRGAQIYLPEIKVFELHQRQVRKPFFPGYLFTKLDFEATGLLQLQWTPGLRHVVAFDNQPVPLADEVIELIRHKLGEIEAVDGWNGCPFQPGDTVRITKGPLQDLLAIFDKANTSGKHVQILLTMLGHANRVQVDVIDLEKILVSTESPGPKRPRRTRGQGRYINGNQQVL